MEICRSIIENIICHSIDTSGNVENKICGATESPLTERGHEQIKETGWVLKERIDAGEIRIDEIITSPLSRAYDTAKEISDMIGVPVQMIFRHNKAVKTYDCSRQKPVIRCSICNGEQVAGFKDKETGHFEEVMLIRNESDLELFRKEYGITGDIEKEY